MKKYFQESLRELNNVTWPTKKQAIHITTIVFIFMMISAAILGIVDQIFSVGYKFLLSI